MDSRYLPTYNVFKNSSLQKQIHTNYIFEHGYTKVTFPTSHSPANIPSNPFQACKKSKDEHSETNVEHSEANAGDNVLVDSTEDVLVGGAGDVNLREVNITVPEIEVDWKLGYGAQASTCYGDALLLNKS